LGFKSYLGLRISKPFLIPVKKFSLEWERKVFKTPYPGMEGRIMNPKIPKAPI